MLKTVVVDTPAHPLIGTVQTLFEEYADELGIDLCFQGFDTELRDLPGKYSPPGGVLLVVLDGDEPIACGAMRPLETITCELKRIYVRPSHRSNGLGRRITEDLIERSDELGYAYVRLDSLRRLDSAMRLYESLGFTEIRPYNYNPESDVVYFQLSL